MKVWVVTTNGADGPQVKGVFPSAAEAHKILTTRFCVAVEMELGKDQTDVHKFIVITQDNPVPRTIDFSKYRDQALSEILGSDKKKVEQIFDPSC